MTTVGDDAPPRTPQPESPRPRYAGPVSGDGGGSMPPLRASAYRGGLGRRWWIVALSVLVFGAAGAAAGVLRKPTYTATATLRAGRVDVAAQAVPGVVAANQALAATYSRMVHGDQVLRPTAEAVGQTRSDVAPRLSASPIPDSPILTIDGTADKPGRAASLANAASAALIGYVQSLNAPASQSKRLLNRVRRAANALGVALQVEAQAKKDDGAASTATTQEALREATADVEVAKLRFSTLQDVYAQSQAALSAGNDLAVLTKAHGGDDDRRRVLERLVVIGAGAGLVIGLLIAAWRRAPTVRAVQ